MTPENPPNLTVVIPTHNRAPLLRQAIESVLRSPLIASPTQVIVVDDSSTDETPSVISQAGVRTVRVASGGPSGSRNAGLAMVETEFVAFLDDDDVWLPGNMEPQLAAMGGSPSAVFAFGRVQLTEPDLEPRGTPIPGGELPSGFAADWLYANSVQLGVVLFRAETLKASNGFDTQLRYYEDTELLLRLASHGRVEGVDCVGLLFRQRPSSKDDAEARWRAYGDFVRMNQRLARSRSLPRWGFRIMVQVRTRGRTAYYFSADADTALREGRRKDAFRYLWYAVAVSPAHATLCHGRFWTCLLRAALGGSELSRAEL